MTIRSLRIRAAKPVSDSRLTKIVDALAGITEYDYNVNDNLVQVDAPNGATTTYTYDDLGNLLQEVSPDRGTTSLSEDEFEDLFRPYDTRQIRLIAEILVFLSESHAGDYVDRDDAQVALDEYWGKYLMH